MAVAKATKLTKAMVWDRLSAINVNDHTQVKKSKTVKLTYLSWAWAYGIMMENYPDMEITWHGQDGSGENGSKRRSMPDVTYYEGGSAMVACTVTLAEGVSAHMWLPVMNYANKAIAGPDTRDISDSKMRCMVKAFAMLGLGHYIYAGEDIPQTPEDDDDKTKQETIIEALITEIQTVGRTAKDAGLDTEPYMVDAKEAIKGRAKGKLETVLKKLKSLGEGESDARE